jgi:tight adherence protein C
MQDMQTMQVTILALTFISASLAVYAIAYRPQAVAIRQRAEEYLSAGGGGTLAGKRLDRPFQRRILAPLLRRLGQIVYGVTPAGVVKRIQRKLDAAGNPGWLGVKEFLALSVLSPAVIVPLAWWSAGVLPLPRLADGLWRLCGIAVGVLLPHYALQKRVEDRQRKIKRSLADAVDLMVVSVDAGIGFDGAMQRVADKLKGPLPDELGRVLQEIRLGKSRSQALKDMAQRTAVDDLSSFVASIHQAEVLGTSIAQVLHVQAQGVRERRSQRAREAAAKLPVKLLFPLVFFIFPALFIVLLGPGVIQMAPLLNILGGGGR